MLQNIDNLVKVEKNYRLKINIEKPKYENLKKEEKYVNIVV